MSEKKAPPIVRKTPVNPRIAEQARGARRAALGLARKAIAGIIGAGGKRPRPEERADVVAGPVSLGAMGVEAEFTVLLDGQHVKPEDVFKSPRNIVRDPMVHRIGR